MAIEAATRFPEKTSIPVYKRIRGGNQVNNTICKYWLAGRCNRNPCKFLHSELALSKPIQSDLICKDDQHSYRRNLTWKNSDCNRSKNTPSEGDIGHLAQQKFVKSEVTHAKLRTVEDAGRENETIGKTHESVLKNEVAGSKKEDNQKIQQRLCEDWVKGKCVCGDKCHNLHSWFYGNGISMLAKLEGHNKAVTGITLPSCSDKLYSVSKDTSLRVWDCNSGQCADVVDLNIECGTLISEGPWMFLGLPNVVKAANIQTKTEFNLQGPHGQVYATDTSDNMLFAGGEDGTILAWKFTSETSMPELVATLKGHTGAVLSLVVGAKRLYSGSADHSIRVWNIESLECMHTLRGHTNSVTSVLCWDHYLLSGSLDNTIKVWADTENGDMEVVYNRNEYDGVLAFRGVHDAKANPILLCSCKDNAIRFYDLPSFTERGEIFTKREVQVIQKVTGGLIFTGDSAGEICVWKLH